MKTQLPNPYLENEELISEANKELQLLKEQQAGLEPEDLFGPFFNEN